MFSHARNSPILICRVGIHSLFEDTFFVVQQTGCVCRLFFVAETPGIVTIVTQMTMVPALSRRTVITVITVTGWSHTCHFTERK